MKDENWSDYEDESHIKKEANYEDNTIKFNPQFT